MGNKGFKPYGELDLKLNYSYLTIMKYSTISGWR